MTDERPHFFVPAATPEIAEEVYAELARWSNSSVPDRDKRVYAITFVHDGEEWTAEVGSQLRGRKLRASRSRSSSIQKGPPVSDPAIVLAIYPGNPYVIVTNQHIGGNVGSSWANPFYAGKPYAIRYFEADVESR